MQKAFSNPSGRQFFLEKELIDKGLKASRESERLRMILPLHRTQNAEVQRIINFLQPGTYIRPHQHPLPHATESIVLLSGTIRFFTFDDNGNTETKRILTSKPIPGIVDIEPGVWHSFLVLEEDTILFECKKGPYNVETDKVFADWAPQEGAPDAEMWMNQYIQ